MDEPVSVSAKSEHHVSLESSGRLYNSTGEHPTGCLWDPKNPAPVTIAMRDLRTSMTVIRGRVVDAEGNPVADAAVSASGKGYQRPRPFYKSAAYSDSEGEFELPISRNMFYLLVAQTADHRIVQTSFTIANADPQPISPKLSPARKVVIRVLIHGVCEPESNITVQVSLTTRNEYYRRFTLGKEEPKLSAPTDPERNFALTPTTYLVRAKSNENGEVVAHLPEGQFEVITMPTAGQGDKRAFVIRGETAPTEIELYSSTFSLLAPPPLAPIKTKGTITDADGKPIPNASLIFAGRLARSDKPTDVITDTSGEFEVDRSPRSTFVRVLSPDEELGASATISTGAAELTLKLVPTAKVIGKLIDEETKKPLVGRKVSAHRSGNHWHDGTNAAVTLTDEEGKFTLSALIVGVDYSICLEVPKEIDPSQTRILSTISIEEPGQKIDLGEKPIGPRK